MLEMYLMYLLPKIALYIVQNTLFLAIFFVIAYFVTSFVLYQIGVKFSKMTGLWQFLIPIYRYAVINKISGANLLVIVGMCSSILIVPMISSVILKRYFMMGLDASLALIFLLALISSVSFGIFWGNVASALGGLYASWCFIGGVSYFFMLLGIPVIILYSKILGLLLILFGWFPDMYIAFSNSMQSINNINVRQKNHVEELCRMSNSKKDNCQFILVGTGKAYPSERIPLSSTVITIGRDPARSNLIIDDPTVSREHARIVINGNCVIFEDLGSSNGSFVLNNGKKAKITSKIVLKENDCFCLGSSTNSFMIQKS